MSWFRQLRLWAKALVSKGKLDAEMAEEMRMHLDLRAEANIAAGMAPDEAYRAARLQFGGVSQIEERCRDERGISWIEHSVQDLMYGARLLRKTPGFTMVALLSLALGIGAATAVFSLLNSLLLRPLPVPNPHELRTINWAGQNAQVTYYRGEEARKTRSGAILYGSFPYPTYLDFRRQSADLAEVFAFSSIYRCTAVTPAEATTARGMIVSGNFFKGYGGRATLGRTLSDDDDRADAPPVTVITFQWWTRRFGLDPNVIGKSVLINKSSFSIVGVLPEDFVGPAPGDPADFYAPMSSQPQLEPEYPLSSYHRWWVEIMARVVPGASDQAIQASLEVVFARTVSAPGGKTKISQPHILLEDGSRGPMAAREFLAQPLYAGLSAVALLLLVACANLAGLMLARGAARRHEYALRSALGARRGRLVRQSLTESLLLAAAGALLGLPFAEWCKKMLLAMFAGRFGDFNLNTANDGRVLAFTFGVALITVLLFGLLPALCAAHTDPMSGLKDRGSAAPRLRLGRLLVTVQVALSMLLVFGAALFARTLINLNRVDPGFPPENLLLFRLSPEQAGYRDRQLATFYAGLSRSLSAIPGVRQASFSSVALVGGGVYSTGFKIQGRDTRALNTGHLIIGDEFLPAMGIPLLLGRGLEPRDAGPSPRVAVVSQSFVRSYFPGENPLGKSLMMGADEYVIVGVCGNTASQDLRRIDRPVMYAAFRQDPPGAATFAVRSSLPPSVLIPAVRKTVASLDRSIPLTDVRTQAEQISALHTPERIFAGVCGFLAVAAVLLSCIGLYGLLAYSVAQRTNEIGIRMAIGARPPDVATQVVRGALLMTGAGALAGGIGAVAAARLLKSQLFGIAPSDPVTLIGTALLLMAVAALASWLPARRAARVDPVSSLRAE